MKSISEILCVPRPKHICAKGEGTYRTASYDPSQVQVELNPVVKHPEGYRIRVQDGQITVTANTRAGRFYAMQTLRQVMNGAPEIPDFCLCDEPEFEYRGFMIDCSRHFFTVDELKKMIDAAALYKLNKFHWHLTDDQGWRIEIESYPLLTQFASKRKGSHFGWEKDSGEEYGGFYTKAEIREVVQYCADRCIEVIPEIDMPGHMCAAIAAYPYLSCTQKPIPVRNFGGIFRDILCAGKESTYDFVCQVLDEVIELFPSRWIHLGGDEAPKDRWRKCPHCREVMEREHIADAEGLQGYFTNRVVDYLAFKGVRATVWNDSLKSGNLKNSVAVQMWMDHGGYCVRRANRGGKVIVSDVSGYYLDYPYGVTPLDKTYNLNPLLPGLTFEGERNIIGVEGTLWAEYIPDFERLCYQAYPRLAAVAEAGWTAPSAKELYGFERRFVASMPLLHEAGVTPAPQGKWRPSEIAGKLQAVRFYLGRMNRDVIKNQLDLK